MHEVLPIRGVQIIVLDEVDPSDTCGKKWCHRIPKNTTLVSIVSRKGGTAISDIRGSIGQQACLAIVHGKAKFSFVNNETGEKFAFEAEPYTVITATLNITVSVEFYTYTILVGLASS